MFQARDVRHTVVHRDEHAYSAHAHAAVAANGEWLVVFNKAPRRRVILHPPEEPLFGNWLTRSADGGETWSTPQIVPTYRHLGAECAGLTVLSNGTVLLSQWLFDWLPIGLARAVEDQSGLTYPETFMRSWLQSPEHEDDAVVLAAPWASAPWVRGGGRTFVHRSTDHGVSFPETVEIDTAPYSGGYAMRSGVELADGAVLLFYSDVPRYQQVFCTRSYNQGMSWSPPAPVVSAEGREFEEPAAVLCHSGEIVCILRDNGSRHLHQVMSNDGGTSWTPPQRLPIEGYPPHLLSLGDGRVLLTYGWRQPDFGIRAIVSSDQGQSWDPAEAISLRDDLPSKNLGYPSTIAIGDDRFWTVYYGDDASGCSCIIATFWSLP